MKLIYGFVFLLLFLGIGIRLFISSRKKKSKIGLTISILIFALTILILLTNKIDELSISKKDILSDLKHVGIELKDDFTITKNKVSGMPERIQETEIQITQKDKDKITSEIRNSANFKSFANEKESVSFVDTEQFWTSDTIFNFK